MQNERGETPPIVQVTQFLLIPVAIGITEELMITMDVLSKMGWKKIENRPKATRLKYWIAHTYRALDVLFWLPIITSLMLYAVDVLEMFLNFAALQFLQCVDNSAYEMAKGSYLTSALEFVGIEVSTTTLPSKRSSRKDHLDSVILVAILLIMVIAWALVIFLDLTTYRRLCICDDHHGGLSRCWQIMRLVHLAVVSAQRRELYSSRLRNINNNSSLKVQGDPSA
mmetsp:Transcript_7170/g.13369  ORF Transcript_7170/g.13369 Transcript_7170/m.13369 type:complete len:225 (-) Transcript_7170:730-1404(-)